jgi:hypothetical protein
MHRPRRIFFEPDYALNVETATPFTIWRGVSSFVAIALLASPSLAIRFA